MGRFDGSGGLILCNLLGELPLLALAPAVEPREEHTTHDAHDDYKDDSANADAALSVAEVKDQILLDFGEEWRESGRGWRRGRRRRMVANVKCDVAIPGEEWIFKQGRGVADGEHA